MRGAPEARLPLSASHGLIPARAGSTLRRSARLSLLRAHPRPCGEHSRPPQQNRHVLGSSPPVRGAPRARQACSSARGLIPARAGSTSHECLQREKGRAHPRPCGEHQWHAVLRGLLGAHPRPCGEHSHTVCGVVEAVGSSPPVRGARADGLADAALGGLIPARAGSTPTFRYTAAGSRAHPRPCGEHTHTLILCFRAGGSSPPVRGAPHIAHASLPVLGLIPARAGSTQRHTATEVLSGAHPRPCGEHRLFPPIRAVPRGSSPPVRGAPEMSPLVRTQEGLIPARAGSTSTCQLFDLSGRAHPRPCGEHMSDSASRRAVEGSSPPVRGAPVEDVANAAGHGLIPARAGSTSSGLRCGGPSWAHPRPCGEHSSLFQIDRILEGSSPPVRGAQAVYGFGVGGVGLIPARAGSTSRRREVE